MTEGEESGGRRRLTTTFDKKKKKNNAAEGLRHILLDRQDIVAAAIGAQ
jgi:hypothetical protein